VRESVRDLEILSTCQAWCKFYTSLILEKEVTSATFLFVFHSNGICILLAEIYSLKFHSLPQPSLHSYQTHLNKSRSKKGP